MKQLLLILCLWGIVANFTTQAQRAMEKLDRSVVAMQTSSGIYVNWRIPSDEWYNVTYNIYRDGVKINQLPITEASNYTDAAGTSTSTYTVTSIRKGIESAPSKAASVRTSSYLSIKMRTLADTPVYELNDATAADLDGDGEYEIIVKRLNKDFENLTSDQFTYFEAYKLDGTFMWAINVGPNIINDVEINILAYDFDNDGKAEVVMRSSEGTIDGLGNAIGDTDGDGITNYRATGIRINSSPYMIKGPEFLSLYDGATGKELDRVNFIARDPLVQWGLSGMNESQLAHRSNKFFFGAPYLDGVHPSVFTGRGIYHRTKFQTYDIVNKKFKDRWKFDSDNYTNYSGQGNHNYTIADIDDDGRDEIVWGSMCVDDDGSPKYTTAMGHGDAMHVGDLDPYRKGLEVFSCLEPTAVAGTLLRDAATGAILHHILKGSDCGRCCAGNITDNIKGCELWGGGYGYSASNPQTKLTHFGTAENFIIYWDGDLLQEICDHRNFSTTTGVGYGSITKYISTGNISTLLTTNDYSCNWSKGTPCLQADIMGDWREEVIWRSTDNKELHIYTTPYETNYRIYTLMHDPQYRQAIAWQMCGYNQPPHLSYFLGESYTTPPPAPSTNGKLVWAGTSDEWNKTSTVWMNDKTLTNYSDGDEVMFDISSNGSFVNLKDTVKPDITTVSSPTNYVISGTGIMSGSMQLNKLGSGNLTLTGTHNYTGPTQVWDGSLILSKGLAGSAVWVNRFASLEAKGTVSKGVTLEYGAILAPGSDGEIDSLTIGTGLTLKSGSILKLDISPLATSGSSKLEHDYLVIDGNLNIESGASLKLNLTEGIVDAGDCVLAKINGSIIGNLENLTLTAISNQICFLIFEDGNLILRILPLRDPASVVWTGKYNSEWNNNITPNWLYVNKTCTYLDNDSVYFPETATNKNINLNSILSPLYVNFSNTTGEYILAGSGGISGKAQLVKNESGTATLNTSNSYTGTTLINEGTLSINGSNKGSGAITVNKSAELILNGSIASKLTCYGKLSGIGTSTSDVLLKDSSVTLPGGNQIGKLSLGVKLTCSSGSQIDIDIKDKDTCDQISAITLTCAGKLTINLLNEITGPAQYKIFDIIKISESFDQIELPTLPQGLKWKTDDLYEKGIIRVLLNTSNDEIFENTRITPNPSEGVFKISGLKNEAIHYVITNNQGQIIKTANISSADTKLAIDIQSQPNGIYFLKLGTANGKSAHLKLIKQ